MSDKLFTVYSRFGCHLCEDMLRELDARQVQYRAIDIDADPSLQAEYGTRVPVLTLDGEFICQYFLDEEALKKTI